MILIISDALDLQIPAVTDYLTAWGVPFAQFNVAEFPQEVRHTSGWTDRGHYQHLELPRGVHLDTAEIRAVWYRKPLPPQLYGSINDAQREYAFDETKNDLEGLYNYLADRFWISPLDQIRRADNKPLQLTLASEIGFSVPDTIITNSPTEAIQFFRQHRAKIVYKTISTGVLYSRHARWADRTVHREIYTTPLNSYGEADFDGVALCPCLFQAYVDKQFEVRVTVVGDQVFAAEIHSQAHEATRHDWRRDELLDVPHLVHELPVELATMCRELVRRLGLRFGAIDLIYTPGDRYVFLEINPNGQYGWIEDETGLPISRAIAEALCTAE